MSLTKSTNAYLGANSTVDAKGYGSGIGGVLDGSANGVAGWNTTTAHGVVVQATSAEDVTHLAIAAGGGFVGVAGGVPITLVGSDTRAWIDNGARVNRDADNAGAAPMACVKRRRRKSIRFMLVSWLGR